MSFLYWYPVTVNGWTCCTVPRIVKDLVSHVSCTTLGWKRKCCRMGDWRTHDRSWPQGMHWSTQPSQSRICQCCWHGSCDLSLTRSYNWSQKSNHGFISSNFIPTNYIHTPSIHPWWNSVRTRIIRVAFFHWYIVPLHLLSERPLDTQKWRGIQQKSSSNSNLWEWQVSRGVLRKIYYCNGSNSAGQKYIFIIIYIYIYVTNNY